MTALRTFYGCVRGCVEIDWCWKAFRFGYSFTPPEPGDNGHHLIQIGPVGVFWFRAPEP